MGKTRKKRAEKFKDAKGNVGFHFHCPGCNMTHSVHVRGKGVPIWKTNWSEGFPSFDPSVRATWKERVQGRLVEKRCHSFVSMGKITFLADSTHELAGQTVDLPII